MKKVLLGLVIVIMMTGYSYSKVSVPFYDLDWIEANNWERFYDGDKDKDKPYHSKFELCDFAHYKAVQSLHRLEINNYDASIPAETAKRIENEFMDKASKYSSIYINLCRDRLSQDELVFLKED